MRKTYVIILGLMTFTLISCSSKKIKTNMKEDIKISNKKELMEYLEEYAPNCDTEKYLGWIREDKEFIPSLHQVGHIQIDIPQVTPDHYWGPNAPIDFNFYPYFNIKIYKKKGCNNLYFRYKEMAGHAAEDRIRLIRRELIVE